MENTYENKKQFLKLHIGLKVLINGKTRKYTWWWHWLYGGTYKVKAIKRHLHDITEHEQETLKYLISTRKHGIVNDYLSFLRSRGFALPWHGLNIHDLIRYGWITIK